MMLRKAHLAILKSADGEEPWEPQMKNELPAWVKAPDVIANLMAGEMATKEGEAWYRAEMGVESRIRRNAPPGLASTH